MEGSDGIKEFEEAQARLDALISAAARAEARVEEWSAAEFSGRADDGGITAVTDALGTLVRLEISARSRRRLDAASLAHEILTAVTAAEDAAASSRDTLFADLLPASGGIAPGGPGSA
ncbi:YbaB/EbfC family nucleoid-associated protein [Nonomuraea rhodomycinica]|uniref:YbaB/EbfC family nucleoid-associated protein n=1 Tax=Nonomuraea rhodomycinica TaxID=1712872 RepID=A0A7Y6MEF8_9ACTN|nr:YbaB/EbfC family nucleoid-associated protein [Nonomuraea rhodomycinica]NUW44882.1 YbaB/EbfC family nucleoid-associated protein [Nonomuraea rhodomycinica]